MARIQTQDGSVYTDTNSIQNILNPINVRLLFWPTSKSTTHLLNQKSLNESEKDAVLTGHNNYFEQLKQDEGYQSQDLIVLHPDIPNLDSLLQKFAPIHTHDDDEVRYIVDGEGVFGFVLPDGSQIRLTIQAGEYINVPAGTEHWFVLTQEKRIKAIRYFTTTEGWSPNYTGRPVEITT
jgi:1,2-dihydroxy-3-keto-5-methylthiopentene dioxygenase